MITYTINTKFIVEGLLNIDNIDKEAFVTEFNKHYQLFLLL